MTFAAIAGLATAAATAYGAAQSAQNTQATNKMQAGIAANGLIESRNQQEYTKALNALALQRSQAGSIDSRGSRATYDPATNTWRTVLSPEAAAIQSGNDRYQQQNLRDVTSANAEALKNNAANNAASRTANSDAIAQAARNRASADSARMKLDAFRPMSSGELEGAMQETSTLANRTAQQPVIADTLRAMARNGTAAGPVLSQLMRDNATTLRSSMLDNRVRALQNVGQVNETNRSGLLSNFQALDAASTPRLQFPGQQQLGSGQITDPSAALSAEIASRANKAGDVANSGAETAARSNFYSNSARETAIRNAPYDTTGDAIASMAKGLPGLVTQGRTVYNALFGSTGAGNAGDVFGNAGKRVGNTTGNWLD